MEMNSRPATPTQVYICTDLLPTQRFYCILLQMMMSIAIESRIESSYEYDSPV